MGSPLVWTDEAVTGGGEAVFEGPDQSNNVGGYGDMLTLAIEARSASECLRGRLAGGGLTSSSGSGWYGKADADGRGRQVESG